MFSTLLLLLRGGGVPPVVQGAQPTGGARDHIVPRLAAAQLVTTRRPGLQIGRRGRR